MHLRTGLLGYGTAGRVFHAPPIATTPGLELSAVVTGHPTRRARARAAHPGVGGVRGAGPAAPGAEVDDDAFVALTHANGVRAHLRAGSAAADHGPRFRVPGSAGAHVSRGLDPQEDALTAGEPSGDLSTNGRLGVLDDGGPLPVDPESAVRVLEVIEAAFTSARTGQVVSR